MIDLNIVKETKIKDRNLVFATFLSILDEGDSEQVTEMLIALLMASKENTQVLFLTGGSLLEYLYIAVHISKGFPQEDLPFKLATFPRSPTAFFSKIEELGCEEGEAISSVAEKFFSSLC